MDALFHFNLFLGECRQSGADVEWRFCQLGFFYFQLRGITLNIQ